MNLEDRLRAELDRSGRSTKVGVAPSIDELAAVANDRRHRNRVLGASGAVLLSSAVFFGSFFASQPNTPSVVEMADGGDVSVQADAAQPDTAPAAEAVTAETVDDAASDNAASGEVGSTEDAVAPASTTIAPNADDAPAEGQSAAVAADVANIAGGSASLQADNASVEVRKRESSVGLASGSGVLVLPTPDGGYVGLGLSFGNSTTALALSSDNGLDWESSELIGVPGDATASVLREHDGTYVALFERFDQNAGVKRFLIGTSTDMVTWEVSAPLAGGEVYATDLAVGAPGVIVIGDDRSPQVWAGPIGGPYVSTGRVDASMLSGVTTLDDSFLIAGRNRDAGVVLFSSTDAKTWSMKTLSSPDAAAQAVAVDNGTVMLRNVGDATAGALISNDGGVTWSALPAAANRGVSVSSSTMGFLGTDAGGAVVAVADDETFSTAEIDVAAPDRLALVAAGNNELVMVQTTEAGTTWIVASR